jgi:mRNA-degrading endonuclease RelE of RelBE toxin-antitoxin system
MYQVMLANKAAASIKKLDKPLKLQLKQALERLAGDPITLGEQLRQPLGMLRSHHVRYKGLEWRIGYQVNEETHTIFVVLIGPHENFYRSLKHRLDACVNACTGAFS